MSKAERTRTYLRVAPDCQRIPIVERSPSSGTNSSKLQLMHTIAFLCAWFGIMIKLGAGTRSTGKEQLQRVGSRKAGTVRRRHLIECMWIQWCSFIISLVKGAADRSGGITFSNYQGQFNADEPLSV